MRWFLEFIALINLCIDWAMWISNFKKWNFAFFIFQIFKIWSKLSFLSKFKILTNEMQSIWISKIWKSNFQISGTISYFYSILIEFMTYAVKLRCYLIISVILFFPSNRVPFGNIHKALMQQEREEWKSILSMTRTWREGWASRHPPVRALFKLSRTNTIVLIDQIWLDLNISWLFYRS